MLRSAANFRCLPHCAHLYNKISIFLKTFKNACSFILVPDRRIQEQQVHPDLASKNPIWLKIHTYLCRQFDLASDNYLCQCVYMCGLEDPKQAQTRAAKPNSGCGKKVKGSVNSPIHRREWHSQSSMTNSHQHQQHASSSVMFMFSDLKCKEIIM
jgi:hypothetical protein